MPNTTWGYLRETQEKAIKAGTDPDTGICRTGVEKYLKVIFPNNNDWIHNKKLGGDIKELQNTRPDYRSDNLKLVIEIDGLPHYQKPNIIEEDYKRIELYKKTSYKLVRIPYFIQLTKEAVKTMFDIELNQELFDSSIPSMGINGKNTPAFLCPAGVERMASEFKRFPVQYEVNLKKLESYNNEILSGANYLKMIYDSL